MSSVVSAIQLCRSARTEVGIPFYLGFGRIPQFRLAAAVAALSVRRAPDFGRRLMAVADPDARRSSGEPMNSMPAASNVCWRLISV